MPPIRLLLRVASCTTMFFQIFSGVVGSSSAFAFAMAAFRTTVIPLRAEAFAIFFCILSGNFAIASTSFTVLGTFNVTSKFLAISDSAPESTSARYGSRSSKDHDVHEMPRYVHW